MNGWTVFADITAAIETPMLASVNAIIGALSGPVGRLLAAATILMIATHFLIASLKSGSGNPLSELTLKLMTAAVAFILVTNTATYGQYVTDIALNSLSQELSGLVSGATGMGTPLTGASFDLVWNQAFLSGLMVERQLSSYGDFGMHILCAIYYVVSLIAIGVGYLIWLASHLFLALFVATGALFIAMVPFPPLYPIFQKWVGAVLSSILLQVFVVTLLTILTQVEGKMLGALLAGGGASATEQLHVLLGGLALFIVTGLVIAQLPGAASSIAGGLAFHTGSITRSLNGAGSSAAAALAATTQGVAAGGSALSAGLRAGGRAIAPGRSLSAGAD